jgi:hypothetical protein
VPSLNPAIPWTLIETTRAGSDGVFLYTDTNAPLYPSRFYRALTR